MSRATTSLPTFARWFGAESRRRVGGRLRRAAALFYAFALVAAGLWLVARLVALGYIRSTVRDFEEVHGSIDPGLRKAFEPRAAEDAGPFYRAAIEMVPGLSQTEVKIWENAARVVDLPALRTSVEELEPRFRWASKLLDEGLARAECHFETSRREATEPIAFPLYAPVNLVRYRLAQARLDLEAGRNDEALRGIKAVLAFSDCLEFGESGVVTFLGAALDRRAWRLSAVALERGALDSRLSDFESRLSRVPTLDAAARMRAKALLIGPRTQAWEMPTWFQLSRRSWVADFLALPHLDSAFWLANQQRIAAALESDSPPTAVRWPERLGGEDLVQDGISEWLLLRRDRARMAERTLLRAAVEARARGLARGAYPASAADAGLAPPPSRTLLADEGVAWVHGADGSLTLSLPANQAAWNALFPRYDALPRDAEFFEFGPIRLPPLE